MFVAVVMRSFVAVALAAAPAAPVGRAYDGADGAEATSPDPSAANPSAASPSAANPSAANPSAADAPSVEAPPIVPVPAVQVPPMDAKAPAGEGEHVSVPAPKVAAAPEPAVEGPVDEVDDAVPYDPMIDSPEAIRARHWIRSGIVFLALGGALAIGAIAMSQAKVNDPDAGKTPCNPRGDPAGNGCTAGGRNRAALALGVPAVALLAGGTAMLVVGKRQQKRLAASLHADRRGFFLGVALQF